MDPVIHNEELKKADNESSSNIQEIHARKLEEEVKHAKENIRQLQEEKKVVLKYMKNYQKQKRVISRSSTARKKQEKA